LATIFRATPASSQTAVTNALGTMTTALADVTNTILTAIHIVYSYGHGCYSGCWKVESEIAVIIAKPLGLVVYNKFYPNVANKL
jgi:hypothetical protein